MKKIDATWDTRSLEVPCAEVELDPNDSDLDVLEDALSWMSSFDYCVVKNPGGNTRASAFFQGHGFRYIESSIGLTLKLSEFSQPRIAERFRANMSMERADEASALKVFEEVEKGLFTTDRIALDDAFSLELAARRYVNWIKDELERGTELYRVLYKEDEVGFFTFKETVPGIEAYPFLAGLYVDWQSSGLGPNVTVGLPAELAISRGYRRINTRVSSNNPPIIKIHEAFGYKVTDIQDVFVRHNGKGEER